VGLNDKQKIVLATTGQPSLNPRLVKEADALAGAGYDVTVIYAYWNDWGSRFDKELISSRKWKAICAGGDPQNDRNTYLMSRIRHKVTRFLYNLFGSDAEKTIARSARYLVNEAQKHSADLYIAHNLGALPAVVKAAKKYDKPCGFDAEDFHRNEVSDDPGSPDVKLKSHIENKYIPQVDYTTASSPQISEAYHKLFPKIAPITILNVFPRETSVTEHQLNSGGPLKLFWFSQTIGTNRGLSDILNALNKINSTAFELHLLGNCTEQVKAELMAGSAVRIHFHQPMAPEALTKFAAQFDIGLALEPGFSINNNLALSNKIFTYLQAGLCVIASDTKAQHSFMETYPAIGQVYPKGDSNALSEILMSYDQHRNELLKAQQAAHSLAQNTLNWETEREKFLAVITDILNTL